LYLSESTFENSDGDIFVSFNRLFIRLATAAENSPALFSNLFPFTSVLLVTSVSTADIFEITFSVNKFKLLINKF